MSSILDFHPTPNTSAHLSDDQLDDQLIGDLAADLTAHLAACDLCTDRLAEASALINSFQNVTASWSERRSATLPIPKISQRTPLWQRRAAWLTASFAFAIGITFTSTNRHTTLKTADLRPVQTQSAQRSGPQLPALTDAVDVPAAPPAAQVSADNQMLQDIDDELHPVSNSPAVLGLAPVSDNSNWPAATDSVQD